MMRKRPDTLHSVAFFLLPFSAAPFPFNQAIAWGLGGTRRLPPLCRTWQVQIVSRKASPGLRVQLPRTKRRAGFPLLFFELSPGDLPIAPLDLDTEITSAQLGCRNQRAAAAGKRVKHQVALARESANKRPQG